MIEFSVSVEIERPPEEVFEFIVDFENTPKWNYFVTDVAKRTSGPAGVGTTYHQIRKTDRQDYQITELDPGRLVEIRTTPGSAPWFTMRYEFEAISNGTRLHDHWKLDSGQYAVLEILGSHRVRTAVRENLGKLKELLETGATQLQDGRVSVLR
jgi:uncharacterized protein YndB with AHSA1/START domain